MHPLVFLSPFQTQHPLVDQGGHREGGFEKIEDALSELPGEDGRKHEHSQLGVHKFYGIRDSSLQAACKERGDLCSSG